jgi:hypothetical protein
MKKRIALPTAKSIQMAVLVAASTGLIREAYNPYPDMQPNPQYKETVYKKWAEAVYVRPSHNQYHKASDWRKQQIQASLDKINTIRGQIRTKAEVWQKDRDTRIVAVTPAQRTALHAEKLLTAIANTLA